MKDPLLTACWALLAPIIRILIKNGVPYKAFSELGKTMFVELASQDYGINGRPTNINRISILTGLDRKTVKQVKEDQRLKKSKINSITDRITRVLSGWHNDSEFLDEQNQPIELLLAGKEPTLETLLRRYSGDIRSTAMLKELQRLNLIEKQENGRWKAKSRCYIATGPDQETISRAFLAIGDLANNVFHNFYLADEKTEKRFERRVVVSKLPEHLIPEFHELVKKEGQKFLETLDNWLTLREIDPEKSTNTPLAPHIGLGIYSIEREIYNDE